MSHDSSLEPVLRAVEPAARLVPERHLRQVLHYLIDWGHPLPTNPDLPFWVSRDDLTAADVLQPHVMAGTEPALLLITDPNDRMIERLPRAEQLRVYWEVLFEAAIMREIDRKLAEGALTPALCRERLNRFGPAARREIGYVLRGEHLVAHDVDEGRLYRSFACVYLRAASFQRHRLDELFPSLPHGDAVPRLLTEDVDAAALLARTRPEGAAEPHREPEPDEHWIAPEEPPSPPPMPAAEPGGWLGQALEAERNGNNVRAAILRMQAAHAATGEAQELALSAARTSLGKVVDALGDLFKWDHDTRQEWRQALWPVLEAAVGGVWPRAARCLYELQKIPADLSREVYAVDLAESIRTFGKRPVKRALPRARPVLLLMGLRRAQTQLIRANLSRAAHLRIDRLLHHQIEHVEHGIREEFTPIIVDALNRAGLVPSNTVEEIGRDKLVAELLDRVCARGYLRIGDLRDAIARNRLKLPDLSGPGEFFGGDPLLKADINLAYALDGVYRKGEIYLRGLQRASSLFFANPVGRAIFLYALLPFLGGFMTVIGAQEMSHIAVKLYTVTESLLTGKPAQGGGGLLPLIKRGNAPPDGIITADEVQFDEEGDLIWEDAPHPLEIAEIAFLPTPTKEGGHAEFHVPWGWVGSLTVIIFLLIHAPPFRRIVGDVLAHAWLVVRGVLWDLPTSIWRSRTVRGFRQSRPIRLLMRRFWSPLLISAIILGGLWLAKVNPLFLLRWGWLIWAVLTFAYNTPWGWVIQDRIAEAVSDWWRVVRVNLLPGLLATIIDWFRRLGNWIERLLYRVDERLRFRGGDSQGSLVTKAILGLLWFPIAYIFRFAFYLLLEPQINPVKHFPVVTVSHKLLLPLVPSFGDVLENMTAWSTAKAQGAAFTLIACVPGIFGFIAWELLSNWQLYRANRSKKLKPVTLGSHGESMRGLLTPGFHSGTVPKLFRKLRKATGAKASRLHHELDHAGEAVHRFVERELVHLLAHSPEWGGLKLEVGHLRFGCQRLAVELLAPSLGSDAFIIGFENVGGMIEANIEQVGWVDKLTDSQRLVFIAALRGFLDMAAAGRIDGNERTHEVPPAADLADLTRRVWSPEWEERWKTK